MEGSVEGSVPIEGSGEEMTPTEGSGKGTPPTEGPGEEVSEPGSSVATITGENREAFLASPLGVLDGTRFAEIHAFGDDLLESTRISLSGHCP